MHARQVYLRRTCGTCAGALEWRGGDRIFLSVSAIFWVSLPIEDDHIVGL
jgi:hypothetical protein